MAVGVGSNRLVHLTLSPGSAVTIHPKIADTVVELNGVSADKLTLPEVLEQLRKPEVVAKVRRAGETELRNVRWTNPSG